MDPRAEAFVEKADESLTGARAELANDRYNNCVNRCYYACLQMAVAALLTAGIRVFDPKGRVSHDAVQAQFAGQLVRRRKQYSAEMAGTLSALLLLRGTADYSEQRINPAQARRAVDRARAFVDALGQGIGGDR